ncbi:hypothetical protein [Natrinema sp. HArc-T2]|uniref:hypothetical protein n=1 Tax=Natrinema sp. HArc-T2 TaxID=3242701 RepID=UPI00359DE549
MPSLDLRSFVARAATLVDSSPPATKQETRNWLVEPFLETLGWSVRADSCLTDHVVDDTPLEYVLTVESVPALFVAVESASESLDGSRANALQSAMAWSGVDRAIYTNGRKYLLLAGSSEVDYCALELTDFDANQSVIERYSRMALGQRLGRHTRAHVARQLAVERPTLGESITDRLADTIDESDPYTDELEAAVDSLLDRLIVAFAGESLETTETTADISIRFSESAGTDDSTSAVTEPDGRAPPNKRADDAARTGDSDDSDVSIADESEYEAEAAAENGEYVARFFNDRGSIGAIGHSTSTGALVEAAEYLFEHGLSGVEVPWSPTELDETVLNADPAHADGSPMGAPAQLSNGLCLETVGDIDDRAARVEALAERAGLRAMLTGDWDEKQ